jgi:hypothetical protein
VNHRSLAEIDAERAALSARLTELQIERDAARQAQIDGICRLFDAGMAVREIAREVKQTPAAVQGVLFRSGRTEGGRIAIRHQIENAVAHVEHVGPAGATRLPERANAFPGAAAS